MRTSPSIALIAGLLLAAPVAAQNQPVSRPGKGGSPASKGVPTPPKTEDSSGEATPVALAEKSFVLESVGLTMHLPEGAIAQTNRVLTKTGEQTSVEVMPPSGNPEWLINIQTPQSRDMGATAQAVASRVLDELLASVGVLDGTVKKNGTTDQKVVSTRCVVLEPVKAVELVSDAPEHSRPAARFYVKLPPGNEKQPPIIRGYTVFQVEPGKFVTFDLTTTEPRFARAKLAYETTVGTARFVDATTLAASRGAAVESGMEFLSKLTPADLDAAVARMSDQWLRLSSRSEGASDADATELAYKRIRAWKGERGEIDPARNPAKFSSMEHQQGYLLRIDARSLQNGQTIDSVGVYFMSPDRKEEAWTLQMAVRDPSKKKPQTWTQTGARSGPSMSVTTSSDGASSNSMQPLVPRQGYLNQVEVYLLPQLLINAKVHGEFGFYSFLSSDTDSPVVLRRETVAEAADRAGAWLVTTRAKEGADPQVSTYNERGELVQATLGTEVKGNTPVWTPVTLQRIAEIWRSKGLPMN
jgi:hypothetical protein